MKSCSTEPGRRKFRFHTDAFVCQKNGPLRKFSTQMLGTSRSFWTTFPRMLWAPPRPAPPRSAGLTSHESLGAVLRLHCWGRGDVGLRECPVTHFLPGSEAGSPCGGFESCLLTLSSCPSPGWGAFTWHPLLHEGRRHTLGLTMEDYLQGCRAALQVTDACL